MHRSILRAVTRTAVAALALAAVPAARSATAPTIAAFEPAGDDAARTLRIRLSDGRRFDAPRTHAEQAGFSRPKIAPNRRLIGWTVDFGNCCTSYALPRALAVHDGRRVVRLIEVENLSIFNWRFSADSRELLFWRMYPHGSSPLQFRRVRIADGRVLGALDCMPPDPAHPEDARVAAIPAWVKALHAAEGDGEALDCVAE